MDALEVRELSNERAPRVGHRADRAMTPSVVPGSRTALVVAAMGGDDVAFTRLAQADAADAYRVAYVLLGSSADAQEVTQEALLRAWLQLPGLRGPERWPAGSGASVNAARTGCAPTGDAPSSRCSTWQRPTPMSCSPPRPPIAISFAGHRASQR